ncbi:four helix bundle protein [Candidatus Uhrbacteria bacterium]|nr:four helix bundle protein [Candidatus Uhrbacteria bacterium]
MHDIHSFKDLIVWQRSMELAKQVYVLCRSLPKEEQFGLIAQMRRCAVSIPSNIAEGYQRRSRLDYGRFLKIADGSCSELETQLLLSKSIYPQIVIEKASSDLTEVQKMLYCMITKLSN